MSRRTAISARGARRLLESAQPVGPHERGLAEVLAALAAGEDERAAPDALVAAFAVSANGRSVANAGRSISGSRARGHRGRRAGARTRRVGTGTAVKAGAVVLVLSGGTMASAAADVLPAPAQRIVHSLFGSWGVPAPHNPAGTGPARPTSSSGGPIPNPSPSPDTPAAPAASEATGTSDASAAPSTSPSCQGHAHSQESRCVVAATRSAGPAASQGATHASPGAGGTHTATPRANTTH